MSYFGSEYFKALGWPNTSGEQLVPLQIPAYCPLTLGVNKDGRKVGGLAYVCQRVSDGKFLDGKNAAWVDLPVLNALKERGRDAKGNSDPKTAALRGSYVPADPLAFTSDSDQIGQFVVTYHDKSKDNLIVGSQVFQNGFKIKGQLVPDPTPTPTPSPTPTPQAAPQVVPENKSLPQPPAASPPEQAIAQPAPPQSLPPNTDPALIAQLRAQGIDPNNLPPGFHPADFQRAMARSQGRYGMPGMPPGGMPGQPGEGPFPGFPGQGRIPVLPPGGGQQGGQPNG